MGSKHHFVPEWYQRRFIPPGAKDNNLWYLDLAPDRINHPDGGFHFKKALRRLGPDECFYVRDLYTLHFGKTASEEVERKFFGDVDRRGAPAIDGIAEFDFPTKGGSMINPFIEFMSAQRLRTPKGLDHLKSIIGSTDHEGAVESMTRLYAIYCTMWMEGVWEVFHCDHTETQLIFSDHPVTVYNKQFHPESLECQYPSDPGIHLLGTRTLYPLDPQRLLVITNLGYARNHWAPGSRPRTNPRYFGHTIKYLEQIQTGRQLNEGEVRAVNYVIKRRAKRFIAAGKQEWLYPETTVRTKCWKALGGEFFLRPDPRRVGFSGEIFVGMKDGTSWGMDEYGRMPATEDPERQRERSAEWDYYIRTTKLWDERFGHPKPKPRNKANPPSGRAEDPKPQS